MKRERYLTLSSTAFAYEDEDYRFSKRPSQTNYGSKYDTDSDVASETPLFDSAYSGSEYHDDEPEAPFMQETSSAPDIDHLAIEGVLFKKCFARKIDHLEDDLIRKSRRISLQHTASGELPPLSSSSSQLTVLLPESTTGSPYTDKPLLKSINPRRRDGRSSSDRAEASSASAAPNTSGCVSHADFFILDEHDNGERRASNSEESSTADDDDDDDSIDSGVMDSS
jgi:hypothetical protein